MRILLPFLLLPLFAPAQQVEPVISPDYLALIRKDSLKNGKAGADTTNSIRNTNLRSLQPYNGYPIKRIVLKKGGLRIEPATSKVLYISGHFTNTAEVKKINRLPALQSSYVQGRSANDQLQWRGPETNEVFSFGPHLTSLEYDNSSYPYDLNGRLVPAGTGSGRNANAYSFSLFRNAAAIKQSLMTNGRYVVKGRQVLIGSIKFGHGYEQLSMRHNKNSNHDFAASLEAFIEKLTIGAGYNTLHERYSNSNRNGFLNRVYQNSLLSPVSFDNSQGSLLGNGQRSYSMMADNPLFLLEDNANSFSGRQQRGDLHVGGTYGKVKVKLSQSVEKAEQVAHEGYKRGSALFPNGIGTKRVTNDNNYFLKANATKNMTFSDYAHKGTAGLNYVFSNNRSRIAYEPGNHYQYQRNSHNLSLYYQAAYNKSDWNLGLALSNKLYASNTTKSDFFLPAITGHIGIDNFFNMEDLYAKFAGSLNYFNSETPVNRSFAQNSLVNHATHQFFQYFPVTELARIDGLSPIRTKEWQVGVDLFYNNKISLSAEFYTRLTRDDIFLVYENGMPALKNLATHRNKGIELVLSLEPYLWRRGKLMATTVLSFHSYRSKVIDVMPGYDHTPIAGFSNVHKAVVKNQPLGAIVGNRFQKDGEKRVIIDNDGFPLVAADKSVIGNPIPDFVMKLNNRLNWKKWLFNIDWEWKKGGDVWNGTQATLDYYGRSAGSADFRNIASYVFPGVTQDGHPNNKPVSFYDSRMPVEQNRWTRYGHSGVAEEYIQAGDHLRINNIGISYKVDFRKHIRSLSFGAYVNNLIIWTPYKGADPNQLLLDQPGTLGLDFFNLPSLKTFGLSVTTQF